MLDVIRDVPLQHLNTLSLPAWADSFVCIENPDQLPLLSDWLDASQQPLLVLGGGSNLVLGDRVPGMVAKIEIRGWQRVAEQANRVRLRVGAGESWHATVERALSEGLFGLENLALIPGTVGAAPVQNIGAYGVELKDRVHAVQVYDRTERRLGWLDTAACRFGYRDSLFKSIEPERYIITAVEFDLSREPELVLEYGGLSQAVPEVGATPQQVFEAVCRIRRDKLPDPVELGNAGSFFQNPVVDAAVYTRLLAEFPDLVAFPEAEGRWKLAAGWLIDRCGLKGVREGEVGTYAQQALVLVNWGGAHRSDVESFATRIQQAVRDQFAVELVPEPRFYPGQ